MRARRSKKAAHAYARAVRERGADAVPPPPPRFEPCKVCGGTGLRRIAENEEDADAASSLTVAIVGGGVAGLATALALRHRGVPCTVYERDRSFDDRRRGYGLTMQQGARALRGLGYDDDDLARYGSARSERHLVFDHEGAPVGEWGPRVWGATTGRDEKREKGRGDESESNRNKRNHNKRKNAHVPRQELRRLLLDRLDPDTVRWGHRFVGYEEHNAGDGGGVTVVLRTDDGEDVRARASVLIGADGIRSRVRRDLVGEDRTPLRYLGCVVLLGILEDPSATLEHNDDDDDDETALDVLDGATAYQISDGSTRLFGMPFRSDGATMWQLSWPAPDEREAAALGRRGGVALKEAALERCGAWRAPVPALLRATDPADVSGYPVYDRELLTPATLSETRPDDSVVALAGDAAHPMSPFKGQGANQALLDAVDLGRTLYRCTRRGDDVARALRDYEERVLERSAAKVEASAAAAKFLHTDAVLVHGNVTRGAAARRQRTETEEER